MDRISIFNYEAYYLDYLEGNLNEEDTAMFLAFLEEYPECKVDGDDMPLLSAKDTPSYQFKEDLKEVDSTESITLANVDHFLTELSEGIIEDEKKEELTTFINANNLSEEEKLAKAVYFAPDESVVFANKANLKQKEVLVLWPYISAAAAACIIFAMLLWSNNQGVIEPNNGVVAEDTQKLKSTPNNEVKQENAIPEDQPQVQKTSVALKDNSVQNEPFNLVQDGKVDKIDRSPVRPIITTLDDKQIASITKQTFVNVENPEVVVEQQDYASLHFADMQNPIEPITNLIAEKTNTALDFRTSKATKKKAGGFFVKIGKFELSHKRHKK